MKNDLSDDLHDYVRSNEGANFKIYETLEVRRACLATGERKSGWALN
jgi:hypothetical protein